jgi:hypothetical protein
MLHSGSHLYVDKVKNPKFVFQEWGEEGIQKNGRGGKFKTIHKCYSVTPPNTTKTTKKKPKLEKLVLIRDLNNIRLLWHFYLQLSWIFKIPFNLLALSKHFSYFLLYISNIMTNVFICSLWKTFYFISEFWLIYIHLDILFLFRLCHKLFRLLLIVITHKFYLNLLSKFRPAVNWLAFNNLLSLHLPMTWHQL